MHVFPPTLIKTLEAPDERSSGSFWGLRGGHLEVWTEVNSGTEVELTFPASVAYAGSRSKLRFPALWHTMEQKEKQSFHSLE